MIGIARDLLGARLAKRRGRVNEAVAALERAVAAEDGLAYDEPSDWPEQPVRQRLGALLLTVGRAADAERIFREDLNRNPENGWSLIGLAKALRNRGSPEADTVERAAAAWAHADVKIASPAF